MEGGVRQAIGIPNAVSLPFLIRACVVYTRTCPSSLLAALVTSTTGSTTCQRLWCRHVGERCLHQIFPPALCLKYGGGCLRIRLEAAVRSVAVRHRDSLSMANEKVIARTTGTTCSTVIPLGVNTDFTKCHSVSSLPVNA